MFARTERLLLRPAWPEDADALQGLAARTPGAPAREELTVAALAGGEPRFPVLMIMLRTAGAPRLIGGISTARVADQEDSALMHVWIACEHRGLGHAGEACRAALAMARAVGHRRLVVDGRNADAAGRRLLARLGFRALQDSHILDMAATTPDAPAVVA